MKKIIVTRKRRPEKTEKKVVKAKIDQMVPRLKKLLSKKYKLIDVHIASGGGMQLVIHADTDSKESADIEKTYEVLKSLCTK